MSIEVPTIKQYEELKNKVDSLCQHIQELQKNNDAWLKPKEVESMLNIKYSTLQKLTKDNVLRNVNTTGNPKYLRSEVLSFMRGSNEHKRNNKKSKDDLRS